MNKIIKKTNFEYSSPHFLKLSQQPTESLLNQTVYTIGHPEGALKKVTELDVLHTDGQDIRVGGALISGQSGSPVVDSHDEVIGVVKTSQLTFTSLSPNGLNNQGGVVAISEVTGKFQQLNNDLIFQNSQTGTLQELNSIEDAELSEKWFENLEYFVALKRLPQDLADRGAQELLNQLFARCSEYADIIADGSVSALESRKDLSFSDCAKMKYFLNCSEDKDSQMWSYQTCPKDEERQKYSAKIMEIFNSIYNVNGQLNMSILLFAGDIQVNDEKNLFLKSVIDQKQVELSLELAYYVMQIEHSQGELRPSYQGVDLIDLFLNYRSNPNYKYNILNIVNGIIYIANNQLASINAIATINSLIADPNVSLSDKFRLEQIIYRAHL